MQRIDAHQHFWQYDPVRDNWIGENMKVLQKDFMPADLAPLLAMHHLDGCVAVQADQSEEETRFLLRLADEYPFIRGVVGWVDLRAADIGERLAFYASFHRLKGFRHIVQGEPEVDFILQKDFMRGIAQLQRFGFTYDILVYPRHLKVVQQFVGCFPGQRFVVDHLGKPCIRDRQFEEWQRDLIPIGQHPEVFCKLSGLVTEADWKHWRRDDFIPYLDTVVDVFGPGRLLFGSDWPVSLLAASYTDVVQIIQDYFAPFSKNEKEMIFGGNAIRFYNLT